MSELQKPGEPSFLEVYKRFIAENPYADDETARYLVERIEDGEEVWVADSTPKPGYNVYNFFAFGDLYLSLIEENGKVDVVQTDEHNELVSIAQFVSLSKPKNYANAIAFVEKHYQDTLETTLAELEDVPEAS
jgi:hypothetical protein